MDYLTNKNIVILGLARQGKALARFAVEVGANVTVSDLRAPEKLETTLKELGDLDINFVLGEHPMSLLDKADVLAISGGVPADAPFVMAARERNIAVTNDSQEFIKRAPTAVIGITGSAGKTTTTALTGVISQVAGRRTWVGGNIGKPLIADLHKMAADDVVVQELSSFQLEIWDRSPQVAAVLNITPNHLDRHKTMKAYINAKANILRHQTADGTAVLSADDPGSFALQTMAKGRVRLFSLEKSVDDGAVIYNNQVWLRNGHEVPVCRIDDISLRGQHNLLNVLAAVTLADSVGIPTDAMAEAIRTFKGVEHRLELVRRRNGVQWINDSIATAPERALAALRAYTEPLVLLAGGRDKDMEWDDWAQQAAQRCKQIILFGELAELLEKKLISLDPKGFKNPSGLTRVNSMAEAVEVAAKTAVSGDVVLLSPGGTSFDAFNDFAERGQKFREMVNQLWQQ